MKTDYNELSLSGKMYHNARTMSHALHTMYLSRGSQKRILIILMFNGTMTQKELTSRINIKAGSASEVISKMEAAGLVVRRPNKDDQRIVDVELTESGRKEAKLADDEARAQHEAMFDCLTDEEKAAFLSISEKLAANWEAFLEEPSRKKEDNGES